MRNIFLRFNPGLEEQAHRFAIQLPEFKVSMAKLQGHFLKYKDDPDNQVLHAPKILQDQDQDRVSEMTIVEWLRRLDLLKYSSLFAKNHILFLNDLRLIERRNFEEKFKF
jgi:hypothetical protein